MCCWQTGVCDEGGVIEKKKLMLSEKREERLSFGGKKNAVKKNRWLCWNFRTNDMAVKTALESGRAEESKFGECGDTCTGGVVLCLY